MSSDSDRPKTDEATAASSRNTGESHRDSTVGPEVDASRVRGGHCSGDVAGLCDSGVRGPGVQDSVWLDDPDVTDRRPYLGQQALIRITVAHALQIPNGPSASELLCLASPH